MDNLLGAVISQDINNRFSDDLATLHDKLPAGKYIEGLNHHIIKIDRWFRALDPTGKDLELLRAISDPAYRFSGLTNKMLHQSLDDTSFGTGLTGKQLSEKISRHLRLLRIHGLIPNNSQTKQISGHTQRCSVIKHTECVLGCTY